MRDKRMTEFTGRQMVIRLSPTRRVLVGKDVTHSDAVHDASVYDMRRDADVETLRPRTSNGDAYSLMTQAEYNSVARLVDTLTPAGDWLFIGHYTEMRRRFGGMDSTHEMRVVLATMRGDGWQDYNAVAREETSMSVAIERLANSTPIVHMYGTRERPITLAYAEGYTLRGGPL